MANDHDGARPRRLRIAAAGDIHCSESRAEEIRAAVESIRDAADLVLLAGDLTTHGEPEEGKLLADAFGALDVPAYAVLGNHDWHANRRDELVQALAAGGI